MNDTGNGKPLLPDYIFSKKLGEGTYGTVYRAHKKGNAKEVVAVKCVVRGKMSQSAVDNLITEISVLKTMQHENVVHLKDFRWDERYIYLIMEYCSGGDLSVFIRLQRRVPEYLCREFLRQLASALRYLRERNISHMDLKPQNILVKSNRNPVLKLADFGFAQYLGEDHKESSIRGSPLYMAPEILLKHKYDAKVDLWSVGVILYECLFGHAPYSSKSYKELAEKIKDPRPIQLPLNSSVSSECRDLLMRLLERDPKQRIEFDEFFLHPFLDLEHAPCEESYIKAVEHVHEAVTLDKEGSYKAALDLYEESLKYFVAAVQYEKNLEKKQSLRHKTSQYMHRAEKLKQLLRVNVEADTGHQVLRLFDMSSSTPPLRNAVEIAMAAENYERELNFEVALEKYELSLKSLLPLLFSEPKGPRKDLLSAEVRRWMTQAENVKELLASKREVEKLATASVDVDNLEDQKQQCGIQ